MQHLEQIRMWILERKIVQLLVPTGSSQFDGDAVTAHKLQW